MSVLIAQAEIAADVGFRQVIDTLVELKTPIVGHNMLLDIFHIMERFRGPLPGSYSG